MRTAEQGTHTYLRTHRLQAKFLAFRLDGEDSSLRERARASRAGRAAKTLVKEGRLRVTLVALKAGASLGAHQVEGPVMIQPLRGALLLHTPQGERELDSRSLAVLDAGVAHSAVAREDCALLVTVAVD